MRHTSKASDAQIPYAGGHSGVYKCDGWFALLFHSNRSTVEFLRRSIGRYIVEVDAAKLVGRNTHRTPSREIRRAKD